MNFKDQILAIRNYAATEEDMSLFVNQLLPTTGISDEDITYREYRDMRIDNTEYPLFIQVAADTGFGDIVFTYYQQSKFETVLSDTKLKQIEKTELLSSIEISNEFLDFLLSYLHAPISDGKIMAVINGQDIVVNHSRMVTGAICDLLTSFTISSGGILKGHMDRFQCFAGILKGLNVLNNFIETGSGKRQLGRENIFRSYCTTSSRDYINDVFSNVKYVEDLDSYTSDVISQVMSEEMYTRYKANENNMSKTILEILLPEAAKIYPDKSFNVILDRVTEGTMDINKIPVKKIANAIKETASDIEQLTQDALNFLEEF